jgi:N-acetylglutamate synthase-like GNAT family acetyltransferase
MQSSSVRNLEKKDAPEVALLILQLTKNIIEPDKLQSRIEDLSVKTTSQFFVAQLKDAIVGFGGLAWYVIPSKGLIGWVEEVVVDENHRRQGIATLLTRRILDFAKEKDIKQLKLTSSTKESTGMYIKLGFSKKDHEYLIKNI